MDAKYLDEIWTKYQIRDIVEANWGPDAPKCTLVTEGFKSEDLQLTQALIEAAFNTDPNALPIDFQELLDRAGIPTLSAKEQQDREEAAAKAAQEQQDAAAQAAADAGVPPGQPPGPGQPPQPPPQPGQTPQQLAASQERTKPRKYETETIYLSSGAKAPAWAQREGKRRDKNVKALAERLQHVAEARYADVFDAAADAIAETDMELSLDIGDAVGGLLDRIVSSIKDRVNRWLNPVTGELASLYHTAGTSELVRMGLSADAWDVGRDEVQEWARWRAGELVKTIDQTVVDKHIRPWLAAELQNLGQQDRTGVPVGALELAQRLNDKFANYPTWMAERLVRTEAMIGYNLSAADMWERVGVREVEEYDGLGGKSGETDADCLARNGQRVTLDEFREDVRKEHPNGTLGAVPITSDVDLQPIQPAAQAPDVLSGISLYVVTDEGLILSEEATGEYMAEKSTPPISISEATGGPSEATERQGAGESLTGAS